MFVMDNSAIFMASGGNMKDRIPLAPLQKMAWFNLIVFAAIIALYVVAVPLLAWWFHRTLLAVAQPALGLFGFCGLWGFGSRFLYDRKRRAKVQLDEREQLINERAAAVGLAAFWLVFLALCMGVWAVLTYVRHQTTLPVGFLPFLVIAGLAVNTVFQSLAILAEYQRSCNDGIV
jgi:uncharacterized membrane protein